MLLIREFVDVAENLWMAISSECLQVFEFGNGGDRSLLGLGMK